MLETKIHKLELIEDDEQMSTYLLVNNLSEYNGDCCPV